ncbi:Cadherin-23 [Eumeta japonica]|uniref:Cadherin-23 n=1 Tax=Eumeta variegata TaxID=151549 RepID=A0A4C1YGH3_EUMVA|nr:Cadherin-23 [Eumeta japonica]
MYYTDGIRISPAAGALACLLVRVQSDSRRRGDVRSLISIGVPEAVEETSDQTRMRLCSNDHCNYRDHRRSIDSKSMQKYTSESYNGQKPNTSNDKPFADKLDSADFGFDQASFERMPLLVNGMQEAGYVDSTSENNIESNRKSKKMILPNYQLYNPISNIRRTSPHPFDFEYEAPTRTTFFNSQSWLETYRHAQRLKNLEKVIKYLENTMNAKFGDIHINYLNNNKGFDGVRIEPVQTKAKDEVVKVTTFSPKLSQEAIKIFEALTDNTFHSDLLYGFKPDNPGDINALADNSFKSPPTTRLTVSDNIRKSSDKLMFKPIPDIRRGCLGSVCSRYQDSIEKSIFNILNDDGDEKLKKITSAVPKSFSLTFDLYHDKRVKNNVEEIYITSTVKPKLQFKRKLSSKIIPIINYHSSQSKPSKDLDETKNENLIKFIPNNSQIYDNGNDYVKFNGNLRTNIHQKDIFVIQNLTSNTGLPQFKGINKTTENNSLFKRQRELTRTIPFNPTTKGNNLYRFRPFGTTSTARYDPIFIQFEITSEQQVPSTNSPKIVKFSHEDAKTSEAYEDNYSAEIVTAPKHSDTDKNEKTLRQNTEANFTLGEALEAENTTTMTHAPLINGHYRSLNQNSRTNEKSAVERTKNLEPDLQRICHPFRTSSTLYITSRFKTSQDETPLLLLCKKALSADRERIADTATSSLSVARKLSTCERDQRKLTNLMAEIIFQRKKVVTVVNAPDPVVIFVILAISLQTCLSQVINRAPHFIPQIGDMSQFVLPENTPVGTPVYQLKGIDPENGQLRYSISGQYFSVDPLSGVVTLAKALDREKQPSLEVIISITDEGIANTEPNTISLRRVIPVQDVNDNPPIFHNRPYTVNISEATPAGEEIQLNPPIKITDSDEGVNAEIHVVCSTKDKGSDSEACSTFKIITDEISPGEYEIRLFLREPLDYESRSAYIISLEASDVSDRPLKAHASIAVTVSDVQDQPPVFLNAPFSATVPENTKPDTSIMEIIAKDGDTANPRPVLITIEGDLMGYFDVVSEPESSRAVLVTTAIPIDRESDIVMQNGGVYSFFVKATELINNEVPSDYTVSQVTIIVTDVDDHIPEFNKENFDISIPENIEAGSPLPGLSLYVEDNDIGQNSRYNLHLRDVYNSEGIFGISITQGEGRTPVGIKILNSSKLDYDVNDEEQRYFSFDVVASVNKQELSSTRVNIKLFDINDNSPVFDRSVYKFNIPENSTVDSKVGDIQATDKDYGIFGEIEYAVTGFGSNFFKTDKNRGDLYVARQLDYEKQKSYSLTVLAKDGGGKVTSISVYVDILDVNDNAPMFELPEYSRTIRDGAISFEPQFIIRATDVDGPTQGGGRVKYSIESDNSITNSGHVFRIDEDTGEISIINKVDSMDTPRGQYDLVIRATDYGDPPLHNETRAFIRVGVPGNQRPTFKGNYHKYTLTQKNPEIIDEFAYEMNPMNYKANIREDAKPGENITQVIANDPDGLDDLLTYRIVSGSKDNFIINEKSVPQGNLPATLQGEKINQALNTSYGATDRHTDTHRVVKLITLFASRVNKTGVITVSNDANLDRDINTDKYEIVVAAVDSGVPIPETATTTVYVTILDVNNKPPTFDKSNRTTHISERIKVNDLVTKITAHDTDINAQLKYSIIEQKAFSKAGVQLKPNSPYDYKSAFRIDEKTGEVFINSTLDYSQASIIILTVKVVDTAAEVKPEEQFDMIEHTIYVQPYADKNPQFTNNGWSSANPVIYHKIKEEQPIGSTVLVLTAEDPISGHSISNFKVINSETGLLQVDPQSGQVVLTTHLDYETLTNSNLTFTVKATNNDGSKYSLAKVMIEVININDNPPVFEKKLYKISILESVKYPEQILIVKAKDADAQLTDGDKEKGYADVRYTLKGENSNLFVIDAVTGVLQVAPNKSLDRERQSVLRLEIEASDTPRGGNEQLKGITNVLIDVLDVNDNAPRFEKDQYTAVVPENVPVGISVVNLTALDPDEGLGGEIKYELVDEGEANGLFTIDVRTGELTTKRDLTGRGRTDPYRLVIAAADGEGLSGDTTLSLYIGDVSANDGVPRFITPKNDQTLYVSENATIGSPVYQVVASDPDDPTQPSGQLVYTIQDSNDDAKVFSIDAKTGLITTRRTLDRERRASYTLVLVVTDRGSPPQQSSRVTRINVTDVDDHKPRFARTVDEAPLLMTVEEEVPINTTVGTIQAVDEDVGENSAIDYVITAGNELGLFTLERANESVGILKVVGRLDRETAAKHILTVKCFKYGTIPKLSKTYNRLDPAEIQVLVKVKDIDDHLPRFMSTNLTVGVRLNVPIDTGIATIKATDEDPEAPPIDYAIVDVTFHSPIRGKSQENVTEVMILNKASGELKIMKNLIHYADGTFKLTVRANNSIDPDRYSDMNVEVVVVRERDLLRLTWDMSANAVRRTLPALQQKMFEVLSDRGLALQLYEPSPDREGRVARTRACFQIRKAENGEALSPRSMQKTIREAGIALQAVLDEYKVTSVGACGVARAQHSTTQKALLGIAAALPALALIATLVLCCLHSSVILYLYKVPVDISPSITHVGQDLVTPLAQRMSKGGAKQRAKQALLATREPAAPSYASGPARLYAEPLYST